MRYLITADWQLTVRNTLQVWDVVKQIDRICKEEEVDAVIHAGDWKEAYNPVDERVNATAMDQAAFLAKERPLYILNGNHDRLSQTDSVGNWGFIFKNIPRTTYIDQPMIHDGIAWLPWMQDVQARHDAVAMLAGKSKILIAHCDIDGAIVNGRRVDGIHTENFRWVFAGHVHKHQEVRPRHYHIGSPIAHTWGEANESKWLIIFDTEAKAVRLRRSCVPGRYDTSRDDFRPPKNPSGCIIRFEVPTGQNREAYAQQMAAKYPGAILDAVEKPTRLKTTLKEGASLTDAACITRFVEANFPLVDRPKAEAYLTQRLMEAARTIGAPGVIRFHKVKAKNVLSFGEVSLKFEPGVHLVTGENQDTTGCSNGVGKTNLFQLPAIALFGRTRKGQTADRWRRRNSGKEECWVELTMFTDVGKLVVRRGRNPKGLRYWLDGREMGTGKSEVDVQRELEAYIGMSWEAFTSSVYVDQQEAATFLTGSEAERQKLFRRLLDLQRFDVAEGTIGNEMKQYEYAMEINAAALGSLKAQFVADQRNRQEIYDQLRKIRINLRRNPRPSTARRPPKLRTIVDVTEVAREVAVLEDQIKQLTRQLDKADRARCGTCGQIIPEIERRKQAERIRLQRLTATRHLRDANEAIRLASARNAHANRVNKKRLESWHKYMEDTKAALAKRTALLTEKKTLLRLLEQSNTMKYEIDMREQYEKDIIEILKFLRVCRFAFQRGGIPQMISNQLLPAINKTIEKYRGLSAGHIGVTFYRTPQETIDVSISNPTGGAKVADQSTGELQLASTMVSMAVRDVMANTDVLFMDEPGHGLSAVNASRLGRLITTVAGKYAKTYIATHSLAIADSIEGGRINLMKRGGKTCIL